jgi:glycosyltransferase involved in cell wall biosynthesis
MISFVWSSKYPIAAGVGGSENYTLGHIYELQRRNIPVRIITIGFGKKDGRKEFPEIEFLNIKSPNELSKLDDTIIFVSEPLDVKTKNKSYTILHCPPGDVRLKKSFMLAKTRNSQPIVTSHHAALVWSKVLDIAAGDIPVVYPFAQPEFAAAERTLIYDKKTVLFAGRLTPDKGVYTLLWAMHSDKIDFSKFDFLMTDAGKNQENAELIYPLVQAHPYIHVLPARKNATKMAELMANVDIVVMPSSALWWDEMFGIVSIEAQHAGCRVVASNAGGLPETDCGGLILVEPDNPKALEEGILEAANLGRLTDEERKNAASKFTLRESVDKLLTVINW